MQRFGNLAASGIAGLLWSVVSPIVAFLYLTGWMMIALIVLAVFVAPGESRSIGTDAASGA